ncbi:DNA adenine methylase [Desulfospira joergensenii]|uniref:DNA adenine methylase n=1 Tax=Desulfospira joergensenii TaxID=53329 RepID=UPI0003B6CB3B|nr:DNA adenine methylase [Desulfospira joergensenii]
MAGTDKIIDISSSYPGGKGGAGVYQRIINLMPPHDTYIETHRGSGAIMRYKRPAKTNIGIDIDPDVLRSWNCLPEGIAKNAVGSRAITSGSGHPGTGDAVPEAFTMVCDDATRFLKQKLRMNELDGNVLVYADPPYLLETRKGGRLYKYEYTREQHIELLKTLKILPCMVMISGYWSSLYQEMLPGWNTYSFEAQTRQGTATEWIWFNYPVPEKLHDYSYLGETFRDRERIKRKRDRWVNRLARTPILERNAIFQALNKTMESCRPVENGDGCRDHQKQRYIRRN